MRLALAAQAVKSAAVAAVAMVRFGAVDSVIIAPRRGQCGPGSPDSLQFVTLPQKSKPWESPQPVGPGTRGVERLSRGGPLRVTRPGTYQGDGGARCQGLWSGSYWGRSTRSLDGRRGRWQRSGSGGMSGWPLRFGADDSVIIARGQGCRWVLRGAV